MKVQAGLYWFIALALLLLPPGPVGAQESPLERRAQQLRKLFADSPGGLQDIFDATFLKQVPPEKMTGYLQDYFKKGGEVVSVLKVEDKGPWAAGYRFYSDKSFFPVKVTISPVPPHKVVGFWIGNIAPQMKDLSEAVAALKKLPGVVSLAALELGGPKPRVLAALNPDKPLAIGSTFKLYILGALLEEIAAGKRAWKDTVTLEEARRSWPSGVLHAWPMGGPVTLFTLAAKMISVSDNTATDHLLFALGRERVEAAVKTLGNKNAAKSSPFLSTREMFLLKDASENQQRLKAYLALPVQKRREYLEKTLGPLPRTESVDLAPTPTAVDKVEWFASGADLCRAMDWLRRQPGSGELGRSLMSINKGLSWSGERWPYVGYKGGSEPGVLNLTWLAQRKDKRWFCLSAGWNDPAAPVDEDRFIELVQGVILLLER